MLSQSAFNAFLKTLEEPPPYAIFILATTEKHKILPTILSRCQIFDFKRITNNDTVEHLQEICDKENIKAEKTALHVIAQKSEGCMRDALSILDKIVSFTNGELTYKNTLEHLNILDEDYYFKLLDSLYNQNLSDALLMYDEIDHKGFEGDMVINGFAEFLRNLLVSKDAKVAMLLEVAEDFKQKYLQSAQTVSAPYIISALNLLNEAEINYKQSRNKRLHVELTLIKLCYLQQALELVDNDGIGSKKKIAEAARPLSFRALPIIKIKEKEVPEIKAAVTENKKETAAKLIIEEEALSYSRPKTTEKEVQKNEPAPTSSSITSLKKIREQVSQKNKSNALNLLALTEENLQEAWNKFIELLAERKEHMSVSAFKDADLQITGENSFQITSSGELQKTFVEDLRGELIHFLQNHFNNRMLTYQIQVLASENEKEGTQKVLNSKEQYLKIIEEYPLVKELKDKLRLELGF
jgi:DNA polymerase-3 subunit gamma/tau